MTFHPILIRRDRSELERTQLESAGILLETTHHYCIIIASGSRADPILGVPIASLSGGNADVLHQIDLIRNVARSFNGHPAKQSRVSLMDLPG